MNGAGAETPALVYGCATGAAEGRERRTSRRIATIPNAASATPHAQLGIENPSLVPAPICTGANVCVFCPPYCVKPSYTAYRHVPSLGNFTFAR